MLEETRTQERRLRLLPSRVVVYFVLPLALSGRRSYQAVWGKLTAGLGGLGLARPARPAYSTGGCVPWRSTASSSLPRDGLTISSPRIIR